MRAFILIVCLVHAAFAAPQFVTFKDGKVGVNFGGYSADAGLGGILSGNAADGGLSASAGTPWGPRAAAGLGGSVDGQASGGAYAGAEANPSVGASSVLSGSAGQAGFAGSEAHSSGSVVSKTVSYAPVAVPVTSQTTIQKIKPPKKYTLIKTDKNENIENTQIGLPVAAAAAGQSSETENTARSRQIATSRDATNANGGSVADNYVKTILTTTRHRQRTRSHPHQRKWLTRQRQRVQIVEEEKEMEAHEQKHNIQVPVVHSKSIVKTYTPALALPPPPPSTHTIVHHKSGAVVNSALNIPIGILRSLQDSLGGFSVDKSIVVSKSG